MSGEYVRSATSRQERDTSGECRKWVGLDISEAYVAKLEAQVAAQQKLLWRWVKDGSDNGSTDYTIWPETKAYLQENK